MENGTLNLDSVR